MNKDIEKNLETLLKKANGHVYVENTDFVKNPCLIYDLSLPKLPFQTSYLNGLYWVKLNPDYKYEQEVWFQNLVCKPELKYSKKNQNSESEYLLYKKHPLGFLGIPKFYGLSLFGLPTKEARTKDSDIQVVFKKEKQLRDYQILCTKKTLKTLHEWGGATIIADCGSGKTAMSLFLCSELKKKTLIICNRMFLMEQWKKEIEEFLDNVSVGWLQGSYEKKPMKRKRKESNLEDKKFEKYDLDKDIVLASIESLSRCEHNIEEFKKFNFIIVDEMHHLGSKTLSQILEKLPARYILGVTATPYRNDKLEHVLYWLCGPTSFVYKRIPAVTGKETNVTIQTLTYYSDAWKDIKSIETLLFSKLNKALRTNKSRNLFIIDTIKNLYNNQRKKILVTTISIEHGKHLLHELNNLFEKSCEFLHGGVKQETIDFAKSSQCRIVLATYQYMEEGYDDPTLDTLVLSMPRSNVQQVIGRCERTHIGKLDPLILDIVDNHYLLEAMHKKRKKFYTNQQYKFI
jgi:superfamily II DNA or RNA helicase